MPITVCTQTRASRITLCPPHPVPVHVPPGLGMGRGCNQWEGSVMNDRLRRRNAAGISAIVNGLCAVLVLIWGKNLLAVGLAVFLLVWAFFAARKWMVLRRS